MSGAMIELLFKPDLGFRFARLLHASLGPIPLRLNGFRTRLSTGCECAVAPERVRAPELETQCEYEQRFRPKHPAKRATSPISAKGPRQRVQVPERQLQNEEQRLYHTETHITSPISRSPATMATGFPPLCLLELLPKLEKRKATASGCVTTGRRINIVINISLAR